MREEGIWVSLLELGFGFRGFVWLGAFSAWVSGFEVQGEARDGI